MNFTLDTSNGQRVLRAEGAIDEDVPAKLEDALKTNQPIDEIWLRSPGGNCPRRQRGRQDHPQAGIPDPDPGRLGVLFRLQLHVHGRRSPLRRPGRLVRRPHVHPRFGDKEAVRSELAKGTDSAIGLIGDVEQDSALLASEDNDFLIRMGVSRKLLTEVMYQQKAVAERRRRQVDAALPDRGGSGEI